jgi:hypothetical protein
VGERDERQPTRGPSRGTQLLLVRRIYGIALVGGGLLLLISVASVPWISTLADARQQAIEDQRAQAIAELVEQQERDHKRVKNATCLLEQLTTSQPSTSVARSLELTVLLSVPSYAQECQATVTIDAPTFGLGKETKETVSIGSSQKYDERRWLLEPEKVGRWQIAVETQEDRASVPVVVTTPLGLSAFWAQVGTIAGVASTIALGALGLLLKRE